jgi:hypothetical protein
VDRAELNALLRSHPEARAEASRWLLEDAALTEELRTAHVESLMKEESLLPSGPPVASKRLHPRRFQWRSVAAGLVVGLFCASVAWAIASPRGAAISWVRVLTENSFGTTSRPVPAGFPAQTDLWSGDRSEWVLEPRNKAGDGGAIIRFLQREGDAKDPKSRADYCDVFRIVDLRACRTASGAAGESTLFLSADFWDGRADRSQPVRFSCHLYLFEGGAEELHWAWPMALSSALASSFDYVMTSGAEPQHQWQRVTTRCALNPKADFAVLHLSAGRPSKPGQPVADLGAVFASNVKFSLKTQPPAVARIVHP